MNFIAVTGDALFLSLLAIFAIILTLIFGIRKYVQCQKKKIPTGTKNLLERNKYALVNTFKMSGTFFNIGLLTALSMTILAFSWTTYDYEPTFEQPVFDSDEVLEVTIRTDHKKPLPPPPPPPVVIPEIIESDDTAEDIEFVDPEIVEPVLPVSPPKPVVEKVIPVTPPPPPPERKLDVEIVHTVVEEMPRFPGCEDESDKEIRKTCAQQKMLEYIYKEINYPSIARETGIEGTVVVRFFIDEQGNVKSPEILKEIGGGCGKEAMRVVNKMNDLSDRWTPGKQRGRAVKVYFNLPVKYKLN